MRKYPSSLALAAASAIMLAIAGCAVGPDFTRPEAPHLDAYLPQVPGAPANIAGSRGQEFLAGMDIPGRWWELFHSRPLDDLIEQAFKANPDLQAAQAALRSAREMLHVGQGALFPSVDLDIQSTRQKTPSGTLASSAADGAAIYNLYTAQVNVGYSPDVFGGVRRGLESLQAQADFQRFQLEAAYLSLSANVVNAAIQEASVREQIAATEESIGISRKLLEIVRKGHDLGQSATADVAFQEAALAQAEAMLPPLEKQLAQQRDQLTVLAGRLPDAGNVGTDAQFDLASLQLPQTLPLGLPSKLVEQRPDVRAAEETLRSASAQVGVATANRLPNITLSATLGSTAYQIGQLFTSGTGFWALAGGLSQPIFHGGALLHQQRAAEAAYDQAAALYRSTVLSAFRDMADTLHAIQADTRAFAAAQAAERAAAKSLAIATHQQELGDISSAVLLLARQSYLQAKLNRVQAQANRLADSAALFQALGGGWWNRADPVGG